MLAKRTCARSHNHLRSQGCRLYALWVALSLQNTVPSPRNPPAPTKVGEAYKRPSTPMLAALGARPIVDTPSALGLAYKRPSTAAILAAAANTTSSTRHNLGPRACKFLQVGISCVRLLHQGDIPGTRPLTTGPIAAGTMVCDQPIVKASTCFKCAYPT